jgi:hypothetical protein
MHTVLKFAREQLSMHLLPRAFRNVMKQDRVDALKSSSFRAGRMPTQSKKGQTTLTLTAASAPAPAQSGAVLRDLPLHIIVD